MELTRTLTNWRGLVDWPDDRRADTWRSCPTGDGEEIHGMRGLRFLWACLVTRGPFSHEAALVFTDCGVFMFYGVEDCCNSFEVAEASGILPAAVGEEILVAEWRSVDVGGHPDFPCHQEEACAVFLVIKTNSMDLDLQFVGSSNGYYSIGTFTDHAPAMDGWWKEMPPEYQVARDKYLDQRGSRQ